jgi:hypothetical protein
MPPNRDFNIPEKRYSQMTSFSARRVVIFAIFVILVILLLSTKYYQIPYSQNVVRTTSTPTTVHSTSGITTTTAVIPPIQVTESLSGVTVLVANGTNTNGAAAYFSNMLKSKGANTLAPTNAIPAGTSTVFYVQGQQQAANTIATDLGLTTKSVTPMPASSLPVTSLGTAQILVVVGPNLTAKMTTTTT